MPEPAWGRAEAATAPLQDRSAKPDLTIEADDLKETVYFPFSAEFRWLAGSSLAPLRSGTLAVSRNGIVIAGRDPLGKETTIAAPWMKVRKIVTANDELRACIVVDAPDKSGAIKPQSLTTRFEAPLYTSFVYACDEFRPGRVEAGRTRSLTLLVGTAAAAVIALAVVIHLLLRVL